MQGAKALRFALSFCSFGRLLLLDEVVPLTSNAPCAQYAAHAALGILYRSFGYSGFGCRLDNIGNRANLTKWQDDFHAYMVEKYPDLERGESASKTGRKHIPTRLFKQAVSLSKQARAIEATLDGINPLNAGKKKEEALSLLKKWFPRMEDFSGQLKKYKVTINDLLAENEKLEARAKASEKGKMKDTMERAKLKSELDNMQRLVDRIPPEVLAELKRQQRHTKER